MQKVSVTEMNKKYLHLQTIMDGYECVYNEIII